MPAEALSINKLADALERDRRTISRVLADVPPDERDAQGNGRWRISTCVRALAARAGTSNSSDATLDALEQAADDVERLLKQLRNAGGVEAAHRILRQGGGRCVGRLDHLMELAAGDRRPAERELLGVVRNTAMGGLISEILELTGLQLRLDEPPSTSGDPS